jgi:hypothetical protein
MTFGETVIATSKVSGTHTTEDTGETILRYTVPAGRYVEVIASVSATVKSGSSSISLVAGGGTRLISIGASEWLPQNTILRLEAGDTISTIATRSAVSTNGGGSFYLHISEFNKP